MAVAVADEAQICGVGAEIEHQRQGADKKGCF